MGGSPSRFRTARVYRRRQERAATPPTMNRQAPTVLLDSVAIVDQSSRCRGAAAQVGRKLESLRGHRSKEAAARRAKKSGATIAGADTPHCSRKASRTALRIQVRTLRARPKIPAGPALPATSRRVTPISCAHLLPQGVDVRGTELASVRPRRASCCFQPLSLSLGPDYVTFSWGRTGTKAVACSLAVGIFHYV